MTFICCNPHESNPQPQVPYTYHHT
uniref:Uncharacterized protein n=1 Tax=Moniliophthora roreri TaxID=221103 RepID=A0A0W0FY90_MONRR